MLTTFFPYSRWRRFGQVTEQKTVEAQQQRSGRYPLRFDEKTQAQILAFASPGSPKKVLV